ncbi:hypothetical protein V495_01089 [Pseudogymnoascus sp. VKM F-4514 (FW-929)]|nr:hypothetical protein V495_01089 [Pseudogymnoascus sp. VKM F-4514 (FW-929)]KFY52409.1 hypothetical protein V497_08531 [Pseudogymnoascus sp. VKM F-4516 (FW-969)]
MVKADLTRDYYGDLEIAPNATEIEIKKQFRALALKYHPDRNPGRELEVNARFQTIQSAHEVLTDPEQRAKYDVGRSRGSGIPGGFASQARPASGFARGNPWANVATDFPPPPRASRSRAQAPPPSAGAQRYANNFKPGSGAYGSASSGARPSDDDGAEARKKTYEAWSKMRGGKAPPPYNPHGYQPTPGTDERRSSRQQAPKPQPPPIPKRTGYAPGAAGGDEPAAANTSAYYTQRAGRAPTAKQQPPPQKTPPRAAPADPLRQFREKTGTPLEPRLSTPYASHGGEKTDPFESVNFGRSNSTRAPSGRADASRSSGSPRNRERHRSASPSRPNRTSHLSPELNAGSSDTNLNTSPKRTFSRATRASNMSEPRKPVVDYSSSSSDESEDEPSGSFGTRERVYAKSRSRRTQAQAAPTGTSQASQEQQSHGAQSGSGPNADPKMYGLPKLSYPRPQYLRSARRSPSVVVDEAKRFVLSPFARASSEAGKKWPNLFPSHSDLSPPKPPSGDLFNGSSCGMNAFEAEQFNVLDRLVKKHDDLSCIVPGKVASCTTPVNRARHGSMPTTTTFYPVVDLPPEKPTIEVASRIPALNASSGPSGASFYFAGFSIIRNPTIFGRIESPDLTFQCWEDFSQCMKDNKTLEADFTGAFSFTFQVDGETFTAHSVPKQFPTSSTENISTTFTPTDWHGKFEAGEDYFGKEAAAQPSRGSSSSRTRNRSPPKPRVPPVNTKSPYPNIDPEILQQSSGTDGATSSPGGTKFSAEEWAQTFKPGTFAPPPHPSPGSLARSRTNSSRRAKVGSSSSKGVPVTKTTGTAAMVDSDVESDKPLFMGSRPVPGAEAGASAQPPLASSPTAMDIDPPQPTDDAPRNVYVEPSRAEWRPNDNTSSAFAAPPAPGPTLPPKEALNAQNRTTSGLAANLDDLKHTEPLHTPAAGLSSFADLTSNLPFASKAATTAPIGKGFKPAHLDLPQPPRGPSPPAIAPDAPRPTQAAWDTYLATMQAYMIQWDAFNTKMVLHFVARKNEVDAFPKGWLGTISGKDVTRYVEGVKEDEVVRTWWDTACGRHAKAMEDFVWAREVFKSGVQSVGPRGEGRLFGEVR